MSTAMPERAMSVELAEMGSFGTFSAAHRPGGVAPWPQAWRARRDVGERQAPAFAVPKAQRPLKPLQPSKYRVWEPFYLRTLSGLRGT